MTPESPVCPRRETHARPGVHAPVVVEAGDVVLRDVPAGRGIGRFHRPFAEDERHVERVHPEVGLRADVVEPGGVGEDLRKIRLVQVVEGLAQAGAEEHHVGLRLDDRAGDLLAAERAAAYDRALYEAGRVEAADPVVCVVVDGDRRRPAVPRRHAAAEQPRAGGGTGEREADPAQGRPPPSPAGASGPLRTTAETVFQYCIGKNEGGS